jgi:beta-lactamase regulating signal transducer with metallopeptidase domain
MWDRSADAALSLLSTYAIHSTILFAAAWLLTRALGTGRLALQTALWRAALLGALATAPLQLALGTAPVRVRWQRPPVGAAPAAPMALAAPRTTDSEADPVRGLTRIPGGPATAPTLDVAAAAQPDGRWRTAFAIVWGLGAVFGLASLGSSFLALRRRLGARQPVRHAWMTDLVSELGRRAGFRRPVGLTECTAIRVPIALGVWRPEICLPAWVASGLERSEHEGLIAHELAHLARRDPAWLLVAQAVQRFFFFQPLHIATRRRLQDLSDLRADDWAVRHTGAAEGLVGCLVRVAEHIGGPGETALASAMAAGPSSLRRRILRLVRRESEPTDGGRLAALCLIGTLVASVGVAAPAVTLSALLDDPPSEKTPAPPPAPTPPSPAKPARTAKPAPAPKPALAPPAAPEPATAPEVVAAPEPEPALAPGAPPPPSPPKPPRRATARPAPLGSQEHEAELKAAHEAQEQLQAEAEKLRAVGRTASEVDRKRLQEVLFRLQELSQIRELSRVQELSTLSREELDALVRETRQMAESAKPSAEEIAKLKEEARRAAEGAKLSSEEIAKLRDEARREADAARAEAEKLATVFRDEVQRAHETEIRALREEIQRLVREVERLSRELARSGTTGRQ